MIVSSLLDLNSTETSVAIIMFMTFTRSDNRTLLRLECSISSEKVISNSFVLSYLFPTIKHCSASRQHKKYYEEMLTTALCRGFFIHHWNCLL